MVRTAGVELWGRRIGAVHLPEGSQVASFEFDPEFAESGIELSPLRMPLAARRVYRFPELPEEAFRGLPGLLADSLPDLYGNALIDAWLASEGRSADSFTVVERLSYIGKRGMGALEFEPATGPEPVPDHELDLEALSRLAADVLSHRSELQVSFTSEERQRALQEILRVGSSAGGARAKALIAFDPSSEEVRSGQLDHLPGFEQWILKFDGVDDSSRDFGHSTGYGAVEYAYSKLARAAGIEMNECRLLEDGERRHFMTKRFDRNVPAGKLHMQSLAALDHLDYNQVRAHSYEQAFRALRELGLDGKAREQLFRRMLFNVVARNQDDHVKNIAFLMDRDGNWRLAPAFDMTYAFNPDPTRNTSRHQMSINGKRDGLTVRDIEEIGDAVPLPGGRAGQLLAEVSQAVAAWPDVAAELGIPKKRIASVAATHRLELPAR